MTRGFSGIGLFNSKNESNIGAAMRAAFCYNANFVAISGRRYKRQLTDTAATAKHIPLFQVDDLFNIVPHDCVPVAIEIVESSISLPKYQHPERAFYIFGPEDGSISKDILNRCRDIVSVPTRICMNLGATVNVVLYDRLMKQSK